MKEGFGFVCFADVGLMARQLVTKCIAVFANLFVNSNKQDSNKIVTVMCKRRWHCNF